MKREFLITKQENLRRLHPNFPTVPQDYHFGANPITRRDSQIWGENAWLAHGEYAVESPAMIKPFFSSLAQHQYDSGVRNFYVEVLAGDREVLQEWFELGFGLQHVSAILHNFTPHNADVKFMLRRPEERDLPRIAELERELRFISRKHLSSQR